jgi:hypothetical protein
MEAVELIWVLLGAVDAAMIGSQLSLFDEASRVVRVSRSGNNMVLYVPLC